MNQRSVKVAVLQSDFTTDTQRNVKVMSQMVTEAAGAGAQVILLPELFENIYFCTFEQDVYFELARPIKDHPTIATFQKLARELRVVLPISFLRRTDLATITAWP